MQTVIKGENREELARRAIEHLGLFSAVCMNQYITIGLCGGRSILPFLGELRKEPLEPRWHFFQVDERLVPDSDKDSNFKLLNEGLFKPKRVRKKRIHKFNFEPGKESEAVERYAEELNNYGGKLNVVILGVGEDAHVAAAFPNHFALDSKEPFVYFTDSPKPPSGRMTASGTLLEQADFSICIFFGPEKKPSFERFLDSSIPVRDCPVKLLLKNTETVIVRDF